MKTKTILFLFLLISGMMFSQEVKRVAILETVDRENKVSYANKLILRANLSKAITQTSGYEAYDRTDIDAIMGEQNFQRTGLVSNDQIKRLGEMTGANYILVAEAVVVDSRNMFITAKLLDVETARTIMTDNLMMGTNADAIQEGCMVLAKKLFHEEVKKEVILVTDNETEVETVDMGEELIRHSLHNQKWLGVKKYTYGATQMDEKAFRKFMQKNHREAYLKYMQGEQLIYAGWGTFLGGLIMGSIGVGVYVFHDNLSSYYRNEWEKKYGHHYNSSIAYADPIYQKRWKHWRIADSGGGTLIGVGYGISVFAGIPLLSVGYTRQKKTINMFNEQNGQQPAVTLNLQASQNGIGLALNF